VAEVRWVPVPSELVAILRAHIASSVSAMAAGSCAAGAAARCRRASTSGIWSKARQAALTEAEAASPLARRPYDLRHAAASLWLNAGVPAPEVARRLGHSVAVLLKVYANCIDGQEATANGRIQGALTAGRETLAPAADGTDTTAADPAGQARDSFSEEEL
jgi:integrase